MKRIILTFVAVLAGTYLFAQNTSYIQQYNDNSHADVSQAGYANFSNVEQHGYYWSEPRNDAYVKQIGKWNSSYVTQWGEGNKYETTQMGKNNSAQGTQSGDLNSAKVSQDGEILQSYTHQYGYKNWIEVYQSGNWGQYSYIFQEGSRNGAVVRQTN